MTDQDFLDQLAELRSEFLANTYQEMYDWECLALDMEKSNNKDEQLKPLLRYVHSLKGTAGSYDVHMMTSICHKLEDLIETLVSKKLYAEIPNLCLKYIDYLREVISAERTIPDEIERKKFLDIIWREITGSQNNKKTVRVLIASSSKMILNFLRAETKKKSDCCNFEFDYYKDGMTALGQTLNVNYNVIIVDNYLKFVNGVPLISTFKQMRPKDQTMTILLSSSRVECAELPKSLLPDFILEKDKNGLQTLVNNLEKQVA